MGLKSKFSWFNFLIKGSQDAESKGVISFGYWCSKLWETTILWSSWQKLPLKTFMGILPFCLPQTFEGLIHLRSSQWLSGLLIHRDTFTQPRLTLDV